MSMSWSTNGTDNVRISSPGKLAELECSRAKSSTMLFLLLMERMGALDLVLFVELLLVLSNLDSSSLSASLMDGPECAIKLFFY